MEIGQDQRKPPSLQTPQEKRLVTIPHPKKDVPLGTVKSILKQAGIK
nr:type II toxin-antitoxin system HicA family toxin [Muricauda sp. CP2A]